MPARRGNRVLFAALTSSISPFLRGSPFPQCYPLSRHSSHISPHPPEYNPDVAIIGGGAMGSCIAYYLKTQTELDLDVHVFDRDLNFTRASTVLSAGSIRQQFSLPENIQLSKESYKFFQHVKENLAVLNEDPPSIDMFPSGYLFLASPSGMETLHQNHAQQLALGCQLDLMSGEQLAERYPWLNVSDLAGGSLGTENEGWFDPWSFLCALKRKNINLGVKYVQANISSFPIVGEHAGMLHVQSAAISDPAYPSVSPQSLVHPSFLINAAGAWAGQIAKLAGIGATSDTPTFLRESWMRNPVLQCPLPITPRKRYVFVFHCPNGPGIECPLVVDPSGVYFRREGPAGYYIAGKAPLPHEEPDSSNLEVDYDYFDQKVWPVLAARVPAFEKLKVTNAWAGYYDYNALDQNGVVGRHPAFHNFYMAAGFSGHGIQMAPAVGKAVAELITEGRYKTVDLTRLGFDRILKNELLFEKNIV